MKLGCDPEVFLCDFNGNHISAIGKIGGSKHAPVQIEGLAKGFTLQEDNVSLEFGIPPATSSTKFIEYIQTVMEKGLSKAQKEHGLTFSNLSCVKFDKEQLAHPMARVFGCEPDYNAWTGEENPKPKASDPNIRSAGGHVHISTKLDPNEVGKAFDLFLVIPAMLMDKEGHARRELYGKPGSIRYKPYGVECRALSNFWIFETRLIRWVWNNTRKALDFVQNGNKVPEAVETIINVNDIDMAKYMIKEYKLQCL